jgi:hypothetical protein
MANGLNAGGTGSPPASSDDSEFAKARRASWARLIKKILPPQQNLWVASGSGKPPSV